MDKYYFYCIFYMAKVLLLFFAVTGESMDLSQGESSVNTTSSSVIRAEKLMRECFADFLILQFGEKTKMRGTPAEFALKPLLVNSIKLGEFMHTNEEKTTELWKCVNNARPFSYSEIVGGITSNKMVEILMQIFHKEIVESKVILVPSENVQDKLHNAQCLLDFGVIEGKILMEKPKNMGVYEPGEESEWFQELKDSDKDQIVIGKKGFTHLKKCLRKGKPFDVKLTKAPKSNQRLLLLDTVDREELMKIIKKIIPFSDWLLKKLVPNQKQKECFADLFVSHFGALPERHGQQFVVRRNEFPGLIIFTNKINEDTEEWRQKKQSFVDCLKKASTFPQHLRNPKHVDNLVQELYHIVFSYNEQTIALTQQMQLKMHNAQCWLDLGAFEGKIEMKHIKPMRRLDPVGEIKPWLDELLGSVDNLILISSEGAAQMSECQHKEAPFEAKLEEENLPISGGKHLRHLQLLNTIESERNELVRLIKHTPFSEELYNKIYTQSDCLAKFLAFKSGDGRKCLLKKWTTPTGHSISITDESEPFHSYIINAADRKWPYALSAENCHLPEGETGVYEEVSAEFNQLKDCVVKMTTDVEGTKAIDVKDLLKMHVPGQLYLHGFPVEFFQTNDATPGDVCLICHEEYGQNERVVVQPSICNHNYHIYCLQKWIKQRDRCPICRAELLKDIPAEPTWQQQQQQMTDAEQHQ